MTEGAYTSRRSSPPPSSAWPAHRQLALLGVLLWLVASRALAALGVQPTLQREATFKVVTGVITVVVLLGLMQLALLRARGQVWAPASTRLHRRLGAALVFCVLLHAVGTQATLMLGLTGALVGNVFLGTLHQGYVRLKLPQYRVVWSALHTGLAIVGLGLVPLHIYFAMTFH